MRSLEEKNREVWYRNPERFGRERFEMFGWESRHIEGRSKVMKGGHMRVRESEEREKLEPSNKQYITYLRGERE